MKQESAPHAGGPTNLARNRLVRRPARSAWRRWRFGYSPATLRTRWEIERQQAQLLGDSSASTGNLELVDAATARDAWPEVHEIFRRNGVGELSPQPDQWDRLSDDAQGTAGPLRYLVHRDEQAECDGVANFRLPWLPAREDAGTLVVEALQAATPEAFAV